ncbi:TMV resistance protein N-like [Hibiscus syriacus]|uniref:TMV resistance protein N-like n=1 Tax=Hibiscus syriacus TaxID=106335 RepID=A0A6A3BJM5_HIBSY|nr:TMV resistance protein N-like [Hibiscus syriacus]
MRECIQSHSLSFNLHLSPPNPLFHKTKQFCRIKASTKSPPKFPRKRRRNPHSLPFFPSPVPSSLPLHSKNPQAIYKDIQTFARQNKLKQALAILDYVDQQGIPVNPTTFSSLLAACVRTKSLADGRQIHAYIRTNGLENNEFLRAKLAHMYTSCGSIEDAQRVFHGCTSNNAYSWNALLRGNVVLGKKRYLDVLSTFCEMRSLDVGLNDSMLKTGLIGLYFKCGKIKLAQRVFEEIPDRDIVLWGAMIAGFAHNRMRREALNYTRWMINEGIYPNSVVLTMILPVIGEVWARKIGQEVHAYVVKAKGYSKQLAIKSVLPVCARLRALNHGMEIHAYAVKNCFFPNVSIVTSLMIMYSKCGVLDYSLKLFNGLEARNVISWTAMIESYAECGCLHEAIGVFRSMQLSKHRPDSVVMARMFDICSELKAVKLGREIHGQVLKKNFESVPSVSAEMIKMYGACGLISTAKLVFDAVRVKGPMTRTAIIEAHGYNDLFEDAISLFHRMIYDGFAPNHFTFKVVLSIC